MSILSAVLYVGGLVALHVAYAFVLEARRHARVAEIERQSCERLWKLVNEGIDQWLDARELHLAARTELDRKLLADLEVRFGSNMARKLEPGKPS